MSDPIDVAAQAAFLAYLKAGSYSGAAIAYPYVAFVPTVGVAYLDARPMLRADPDDPFLAFAGSVLFRGIFQVDVVMPDGAGEAPGLRIAALVRARFPQGLVLPIAPYKLQFLKVPSIATAVKDAPWVRFPVSIPYLVIGV